MISYAEAKKILREAGNGIVPAMESLLVKEAVGRICAEDIKAPITLQPFDNSAMDGFAVRIDDLRAARPDKPVVLQVLETIAAGHAPSGVRHMPGAALPS